MPGSLVTWQTARLAKPCALRTGLGAAVMQAAASEMKAQRERNKLLLRATALGLLPDCQRLVEMGADIGCEVALD